MKKSIILIILFIYVVLVFAKDGEDIFTFKPHYQTYEDSIWFPNTTSYDFMPAYEYNNNYYLALHGGLAKFKNDSLYVFPYPFYGNYGKSIRSIIQIENELWIAFIRFGISRFDMNIDSFIENIDIVEENQYKSPYANIRMKYSNKGKTVWISTLKGLYSINSKTNELTDWTKKYHDLIGSEPYSSTPIIIDQENTWIISNIGSGALLSYNNVSGAWVVYHSELTKNKYIERIHIKNVISTSNFLWLDVRGNGKYDYVAEYDKRRKKWSTYEYYELSDMVDRLINELPYIQIMSHSTMSFPIGNLENFIKYYVSTSTNSENYAETNDHYESMVNEMLAKIDSTNNIALLASEIYNYISMVDFTYDNQLISHDDNGSINRKLEYLNLPIEYHRCLVQKENKITLITNYGLSVLNLKEFSVSNVTGTNKTDFLNRESKNTRYKVINNHIYFLQTTWPDNNCRIYDYNINEQNFTEITPEFDVWYNNEYFWEADNKFFMIHGQSRNIYIFKNEEWIMTDEISEEKNYFNLWFPKEIVLEDKRKIIINSAGLNIYK
jgi:hypothetical protein